MPVCEEFFIRSLLEIKIPKLDDQSQFLILDVCDERDWRMATA